MKNKINKNKSFLKKIFVKLIRKFGYEIIDQSNLTLPDENLYVGNRIRPKAARIGKRNKPDIFSINPKGIVPATSDALIISSEP